MRILITGGSGFIGSHLTLFLKNQGHQVIILSRKRKNNAITWDPENNELNPKELEGFDAIINLAGASVFGIWTKKKIEAIYKSRLQSTELLIEKLSQAQSPPKIFLSASGINTYGYERTDRLTENSALGDDGVLTDLCKKWEDAASQAKNLGCRVIHLRLGLVLSPDGGLLRTLLPIFKLHLGGRVGSGLQWMSWIALEDALTAIHYCLINEQINGCVNIVSPNPVTNFTFKQVLAKKLRRFAWFPLPTWLIRLIFGKMAKETILSSLKVHPQKLLAAGYKFQYPQLKEALIHMLKK